MHPRLLCLTVAAAFLAAPPTAPAEPARSPRGIVASIQPLATEAGVRAMENGGNAIDAAAAVALTLGIVDGHDSGVGGGCFMLIHLASGEIIALDGREMAPGGATRDMFVVNGKGDPRLSQTGALASGIPGSLMVYDQAVRAYGKKPLRDALLAAADVAEKGFPIDGHYADRLAVERENLLKFPESRAIFLHPDGTVLVKGETLRQPDLARSYRTLAEEGIGWFYGGAFAQAAEKWMKGNGGIITAADFAAYHVVRREPVRTMYRRPAAVAPEAVQGEVGGGAIAIYDTTEMKLRHVVPIMGSVFGPRPGYEIISFPPPSSGGVHVVEILNILENFDLARLAPAERVHVIAEAMKLAFADRAFWLGDPDFVPVPRGLADKAYAKKLAGLISLDHSLGTITHGTPDGAATDIFHKHTTHFCTADAEGNWVACTTTLNTSFGSKVTVPGTGILLNNQMDDFSIQPGVPNAFGLVGGEANAVAPGKRPLSSMSPTIVLKDGKPVLASGAAGGPTIITQTVINLVGALDLGLPIDQALAQPRFHQQWTPDELLVEEAMPKEIVDQLRALGHVVKTTEHIGASQMIGASPDGKELLGSAEPRSSGSAAGVTAR